MLYGFSSMDNPPTIPSCSTPSCLEAEVQAWIGFETIPNGPLTFTSSPIEIVSTYTLADVLPCLHRIEEFTAQGYHAVGQIAYEAATVFEPAMRVPSQRNFTNFPLLWFTIYDTKNVVHGGGEDSAGTNGVSSPPRTNLVRYHPGNRLLQDKNTVIANGMVSTVSSHLSSSFERKHFAKDEHNDKESLQHDDDDTAPNSAFSSSSPSSPSIDSNTNGIMNSGWKPDTSREEYDNAIRRIRENIRNGVCYQVNHTIRLHHQQWLPSNIAKTSEPTVASIATSPSSLLSASEKHALLQFHARLLAAQQCGYGAYIDMGRYHILSASPELFFHWDRKNDCSANDSSPSFIRTRPMKGTRARGRSSIEDEFARQELLSSLKERAENLMIVDLLRNDLGRIAIKGTVKVTDMFKIEQYPTVLQMTSTVSAQLPVSTRLTDVLRALFPCGSVTGAPKISAMNIISELESSARNTYCGSIMYIEPGPRGSITASVPIRTVIVDTFTGIAQYGVGGGITWDSTAHGEYEEVLAKAQVLVSASSAAAVPSSSSTKPSAVIPWWNNSNFALLETMRMKKDGTIVLWKEHKERIQSSARYFQFRYDDELLEQCIHNLRQSITIKANYDYRVRLTVDPNGVPDITATELSNMAAVPTAAVPYVTILSRQPVNSRDVFLYHKTTNRTVYDNYRNQYCSSNGNPVDTIFDVLLMNDKEEITEFCIGNIVIEVPITSTLTMVKTNTVADKDPDQETGYSKEEIDTWPVPEQGYRFITPSLSCGLLPGVLRSYLLKSRYCGIEEEIIPSVIITKKMYRRVWLINSVRGWVNVSIRTNDQ